MESSEIIEALAALAQETRLTIYRLLVEHGPDGLAAGQIGERLELPPATLSFHLAHLSRSRLILARHQGRFIYYSADFATMNDVIGYLTDNCCASSACVPVVCMPVGSAPAKRKRPTRRPAAAKS